jgi:hypothetical protein
MRFIAALKPKFIIMFDFNAKGLEFREAAGHCLLSSMALNAYSIRDNPGWTTDNTHHMQETGIEARNYCGVVK